jgi:pyruvate dehydrogenase E1 component alpha subunit
MDDQLTGIEPSSDHVEWLETMMLIREFEIVSVALADQGKIPGGMHSAAGQEALAVGAIRTLHARDIVTSSHRSHHHAISRGLSPDSIMAELYGKSGGSNQGRAGHMHLADFSKNLYGSNGVVGGGLGIALGAAFGAMQRETGQVALGFVGDGGMNTGRVWEFVNLASRWSLPLIIGCENNLYAVETHFSRTFAGDSIVQRASGFGLPAESVDGQDALEVAAAVGRARERALAGDGPTFIEMRTYRYEGHNNGDLQQYRTPEEVQEWRDRDPIARLSALLVERGLVSAEGVSELEQRAKQAVEAAVAFADESPYPDVSLAATGVYSADLQKWVS